MEQVSAWQCTTLMHPSRALHMPASIMRWRRSGTHANLLSIRLTCIATPGFREAVEEMLNNGYAMRAFIMSEA